MTGKMCPVLFIVTACILCFNIACSHKSDADENGGDAAFKNQNQSDVAGEIRRTVLDIRNLDGQLKRAGEDSTLLIRLFDDIEIHARLIALTDMIPGVVSYRYEVTEPEAGLLIVSAEGSRIAANIDLQRTNRKFLIQPVHESNDHIVIEIDPSQQDILEGAPPVTPDQ